MTVRRLTVRIQLCLLDGQDTAVPVRRSGYSCACLTADSQDTAVPVRRSGYSCACYTADGQDTVVPFRRLTVRIQLCLLDG